MAKDQETILDTNGFLVTETNNKGIILFANEEFAKVAEFEKEELIGQAHNIVRHPDMPKAAFVDLWSTIKKGEVWQGYVKNRTKSDGFYWVFATIYPFKDKNGNQCYLSVRRKPDNEKLKKQIEIYKTMR